MFRSKRTYICNGCGRKYKKKRYGAYYHEAGCPSLTKKRGIPTFKCTIYVNNIQLEKYSPTDLQHMLAVGVQY